jgi:hypothetical protein
VRQPQSRFHSHNCGPGLKHYSKPEHANLSRFGGRFHGACGAVSCLVVSSGSNLARAVAENTAFVIGVMEFGDALRNQFRKAVH